MTKYNVGDVLEITEDFELESAEFSEGEDYTVVELDESFYSLESDVYYCIITISEVETHSGFRKVEPKVEFKVGDKVRLLEGAHGNPDFTFSWSTEEGFEKNFGYRYDLAEPFVIRVAIDYAGEVGISQDGLHSYVLPEFLVPWVEATPELKEPFLQHMVLGKTYQSTSNDFLYTPTVIDFESDRVEFDFVSEPGSFVSTSHRYFYSIEEEFGVLPPVKPENESDQALEESKANYVEIDPKLEVPATVSVVALREAMDYLGIQEVFDTENIISLAKRLS